MRPEEQLEEKLLEYLQNNNYTYRKDIRSEDALKNNFREHFEKLNKEELKGVSLSDGEFKRLHSKIINDDVFKASETLREREVLERDDGSKLYYSLINSENWCKNEFEVINQMKMETEKSFHRYDVILLINGLPLVQIELKHGGILPRKALEQIVDYKNDSGSGYKTSLFCFMQIFIVSNGHDTQYFANNNNRYLDFKATESQFLSVYTWAHPDNRKINDLKEFTDTFLDKCFLAETIGKYMVLVKTDEQILMMRPYQLYAVKNIIESIQLKSGNGYIWHTTGSGKTLTSFKASTLLKENDNIYKCLFVVDRKDLDKQTRAEFNKFEEDCVEPNTNTESLVKKILSDNSKDKVIVTTIQKLGRALSEDKKYREKLAPLKKEKFVFIFDECHRSQFGENHQAIKEFFPESQMFGFTGTPIFNENSTTIVKEDKKGEKQTTKDLFPNDLHDYTITHAIEDKNVLPFRVEYYKTKADEHQMSKKAIVSTILDIHSAQTLGKRCNAFFATNSISDAIKYYKTFKTTQEALAKENPHYKKLNIGCVFSPPPNSAEKAVKELQEDLEQEKEDYKHNPEEKKQALISIIEDYNVQFGGNHTVNEFDRYYQDIQDRIKKQKYDNKDFPAQEKLDIVIVVDMLLTGFDSKFLNTLYVDKNLKYHGLIQAFSRTNRTLGGKDHGNIIVFKDLKEAVDQAIALYSGKSNQSKEIWIVEEYPIVKDKLNKKMDELKNFFKEKDLKYSADEVNNLKGDKARLEFMEMFKEIRRLKTSIQQYKECDTDEINQLISPDEMRDFSGAYLKLYEHFKTPQDKPEKDPLPFDDELYLFTSSIIDYDYIMQLISDETHKKKMDKITIIKILEANPNFIGEKIMITNYVNTLKDGDKKSPEQITKEYEDFKLNSVESEFETVFEKHGINWKEAKPIIEKALRLNYLEMEAFEPFLDPMKLTMSELYDKKEAFTHDLCPLLMKKNKDRKINGNFFNWMK